MLCEKNVKLNTGARSESLCLVTDLPDFELVMLESELTWLETVVESCFYAEFFFPLVINIFGAVNYRYNYR